MKQFQYEITKHPSDEFTHLVYFCTDQGQCSLNQIPPDQTGKLEGILNQRGKDGWELVHLVFGQEGIVAFWKREIA